MLKLILELGKVSDNMFALGQLCLVANIRDRPMDVINSAGLSSQLDTIAGKVVQATRMTGHLSLALM